MFKGSFVAIVTPFTRENKVDYKALGELIEFHCDNGTAGIVPCGTTGESATLGHGEHMEIIDFCVKKVKKRIKVIAGTGSNNTAEAVELTKYAEKTGADAALLIAPYYNKPTQKGLYLHFAEIAKKTSIPLIPYNILSRTGVNIEPATFAKLFEIDNIVGVKEASGSLDQMSAILQSSPKPIYMLSGDDALTLPLMSIGGSGVVSVVANIAPAETAQMVSMYLEGRVDEAKKMHMKLYPLVKAMFTETNPIPVKEALILMGKIKPYLRLPMCRLSEDNIPALKVELKKFKLI